jgi:hypothetical protein
MSEGDVRIIPGEAFCQPQLKVLSKLAVDPAALTAEHRLTHQETFAKR